jgi:hypothetical protein
MPRSKSLCAMALVPGTRIVPQPRGASAGGISPIVLESSRGLTPPSIASGRELPVRLPASRAPDDRPRSHRRGVDRRIDPREALLMFSSVIPGLRELRAPLAGGYLWLVWAWMVWGDSLPARNDVSGPLERLYELEPALSDLGVAVVASAAAYIVGSIVIDIQTRIGHPINGILAARAAKDAVETSLEGEFDTGYEVSRILPTTDAGKTLVRSIVPVHGGYTGAVAELAAQSWIQENREVIKTRLLDLSPSLHPEVDRPDAEATLRMALWPPTAAIVLYLTIAASLWWLAALAVPALLAWQWTSLRRRANDALLTAIAAREELRDVVSDVARSAAEAEGEQERAMEADLGRSIRPVLRARNDAEAPSESAER